MITAIEPTKVTFSHVPQNTASSIGNKAAAKSFEATDQPKESLKTSQGLVGKLKSFLNSNNSVFLGVFTAEILEFIIKHPLLLILAAPFITIYAGYKLSQKFLSPVFAKIQNWSEKQIDKLAPSK